VRIVGALKDRATLQAVLDPTNPKLVTGTPEEQDQARREWKRHERIRQIVTSAKTEIPRSEVVFERFWIEHEPSGDFYCPFAGDPEFADDVPAYYVAASGEPIMLQRTHNPANRAELEQSRRAREERRNAPKQTPAWRKTRDGAT
jgi:hypothetical protein